MKLRLASAPVTWGVWERTINESGLIPPQRLLETVSALAYTGIELGPLGYFGSDGEAVQAMLAPYGLALLGVFTPLHLTDEETYRQDLDDWLNPTIDLLLEAGMPGPVVLADAETDGRLAAAGRPGETRAPLSPDAFARAVTRANEAAERCRSKGLDVVFHHHAGTHIETPEEIARFLELSEIGICFDTGHAAVGGGDPIEVARLCGERISYLHLKDVDASVLSRLQAGEINLEQAWEQGLFGPFDEGLVDFAALLALPELAGFQGWTVLEQDRVVVRIDDLAEARAIEERNLAVVKAAHHAAAAA
jgi:inosose dehydratase